MTDIRVHRKDLVIATMGRSFWIMDNITPLQQIAVGVRTMTSTEHDDDGDLQAFVHGPDFPGGGTIMGTAGFSEAYATGRGSVTVVDARGRAQAYAELKRRLAQHLADPQIYPDVKDPAVDLIYLAAEAWAARTGWELGPSDA